MSRERLKRRQTRNTVRRAKRRRDYVSRYLLHAALSTFAEWSKAAASWAGYGAWS